jgi:hypothetical protein
VRRGGQSRSRHGRAWHGSSSRSHGGCRTVNLYNVSSRTTWGRGLTPASTTRAIRPPKDAVKPPKGVVGHHVEWVVRPPEDAIKPPKGVVGHLVEQAVGPRGGLVRPLAFIMGAV